MRCIDATVVATAASVVLACRWNYDPIGESDVSASDSGGTLTGGGSSGAAGGGAGAATNVGGSASGGSRGSTGTSGGAETTGSSGNGGTGVGNSGGGGGTGGSSGGGSGGSGTGGATGGSDCTLAGVGYAIGDQAALAGFIRMNPTNSGLCVAVDGCPAARSARAVQTDCGGSCQTWEVHEVDAGWYLIRNTDASLCIDVDRSQSADGTSINGYDCTSNYNQEWRFVCSGADEWRIEARHSSKVMAVTGASTSPNVALEQTTFTGASEQLFSIDQRNQIFTALVPTSEADPGQLWRYTSASPGGTWTDLAYDDSSWSEGPGGFGNGDTLFGQVRTDWSSSNRIWLRQKFDLASVPASLDLSLFNECDGDIYANGRLVYSSSYQVTGYTRVPVANTSMFAVGSNVLAISCQDSSFGRFIDLGIGSYGW